MGRVIYRSLYFKRSTVQSYITYYSSSSDANLSLVYFLCIFLLGVVVMVAHACAQPSLHLTFIALGSFQSMAPLRPVGACLQRKRSRHYTECLCRSGHSYFTWFFSFFFFLSPLTCLFIYPCLICSQIYLQNLGFGLSLFELGVSGY